MTRFETTNAVADEPGEDVETTVRESRLVDAGITRRRLLGAAGLTAAAGPFAFNASAATEPWGDEPADTGVAIVVLDLEPLARHSGDESTHEQRLAAQRQRYKQWLGGNAPSTEVLYEYETVLNGLAVRLNEHSVGTLRMGPGVRYATQSQPIYPTLGESLDLIDVQGAWNQLSEQDFPGAGVKIAILDTGIEHDRTFFSDDGLDFPSGDWPKGNGDEWDYDVSEFTNEKVIAAYVFWDEDLDLDPGDENGHGTHVAGIAGGRSGTSTDLSVNVSGVAPGAWLGNYNVFAGGGSTASENVIAAIEQATEDGFDVINMSLGGPIDKPEDPLMEASEAAIEAGVVVVSSAGNSGPGSETVTSPAAAPNVIAVGASSNDWGVFDTITASSTSDSVGPFPYLPGVAGGEVHDEFLGEPIIHWADLDDLGSTTALACDGRGNPNNTPTLEGNPVVLVQRGECSFAEKAQNIKDAGGRAMIVYNRDDAPEDELVTMTLQNEVDFPSAFMTNVDGKDLRDFIRAHDNPTVSITFDDESFDRTANILAEFSSRGPGPNLEIKPEVTAPGVNIYSSYLVEGWASLSGTSMASPHTAGSAALQVADEPAWGVQQVRSALVNYGDADVLVDPGVKGPMSRGNGRLQIGDATAASLLADPATVSFGELAKYGTALRTTAKRDLTVQDVSDSTRTVTVSVAQGSTLEPDVTLSSSSFELGAGESKTVTLTADGSGQTTGSYWGKVVVSVDGATEMTVPFWYRVVQ